MVTGIRKKTAKKSPVRKSRVLETAFFEDIITNPKKSERRIKARAVSEGGKFWVIAVVGCLLMFCGLGYLYWSSRIENSVFRSELAYANRNTVRSKQIELGKKYSSLIEEVDQLIVLPNEQPIVETIEEGDDVGDLPFKEVPIVGDKVLLFSEARKLILFRPSEHKLVDIAILEKVNIPDYDIPTGQAMKEPSVAGVHTEN